MIAMALTALHPLNAQKSEIDFCAPNDPKLYEMSKLSSDNVIKPCTMSALSEYSPCETVVEANISG